MPTVGKKLQTIDYQGARITRDFVYSYFVGVRFKVKKNRWCCAVYQGKLSSLVMEELNWRVEDHRRSKTGLLPSLVGQKCDEGWILRAAWASCKSNI